MRDTKVGGEVGHDVTLSIVHERGQLGIARRNLWVTGGHVCRVIPGCVKTLRAAEDGSG